MIKNKEQMAESIAAVLVMASESALNRAEYFNLEDTLMKICAENSIEEGDVYEFKLLMKNGCNHG